MLGGCPPVDCRIVRRCNPTRKLYSHLPSPKRNIPGFVEDPAGLSEHHPEEPLEPRTGYSLDLALPSSRVAVEVDGPTHFLLPDGRGVRKPNGPTLLKRRLLRAAGWRVISVPFYEWDGFATANGQQTYLERAVAPLLG